MPLRISRTRLALATLNSPVPFLYQTRTLTAPLRYAKWNTRQGRSLQSTSTAFTPESSLGRGAESVYESQRSENTTPPVKSDVFSQTQSDGGDRAGTSYLKRRAATVSQSGPSTVQPGQEPPTMTWTEKKAFGNLLEQMGVDGKHDPEADTGTPEKPALSEDSMSKISSIFNSVLMDLRRKNRRSEGSTEGAAKRKRRRKVEKLASTSELGSQQQAGDHHWSVKLAIRQTVKREGAKIESALRAAIEEGEGDIGVWDVCAQRIFPMVRYFEDSRLPEDSGTSPTSSAGQRAFHSPLEIPESVPVKAVVTALYPKMLLLSFRLLNSRFPRSPFVSHFHKTVKSYGRTSAVLGSSTSLYNELIYFYWRGCRDPPTIVSLLEEMETTGVEPDKRTWGLLKAISDERKQDLKKEWNRKRRRNKNRNKNWRLLPDPWWDMEPNQTAARELFGDDGWLHRLEKRLQETGKLQRSTRLLAHRFDE